MEQSSEEVLGRVFWQRPLTHKHRIGNLPDDMPAVVHRWPCHLRPGTGHHRGRVLGDAHALLLKGQTELVWRVRAGGRMRLGRARSSKQACGCED